MLEFKRPEPVPENLPPRWELGVDRRRVAVYVGAALVGGIVLGLAIARSLARPETRAQSLQEQTATGQTGVQQETATAARSEYHKVTRIVRGDTIEVEDLGIVRLIGVETPDGKQPSESYAAHGQNALEYVTKSLLGQEVRLEYDPMNASRGNKDEQDQTLAYVYTRDGQFINSDLVRLGLAFVRGFEQFTASDDFRMLEREAVQNSRGLWGPSSGASVASNQSSSSSSASSQERPRRIEPLAPSQLGANIPALTGTSSSATSEATVFVSSADHMYHKAGCELLDNKKKRAIPVSQARAEGYSACSRCFASTVLKAP
jgi:micrococcal nuclease